MIEPKTVVIQGVPIINETVPEALERLRDMVENGSRQTVFFSHGGTLNFGADESDYRQILNSASVVYGDGLGVRVAAWFRGISMKANLNGTDLVPEFLQGRPKTHNRCYLLGAREGDIHLAADHFNEFFPNWELVGCHHGYLAGELSAEVIKIINESRIDLLLVGMGSPIQEIWVNKHKDDLNFRLCLCVGGLFQYWTGHLKRAPLLFRKLSCEWLYIMYSQKWKIKRYLFEMPQFLFRAYRSRKIDLQLSESQN